MTAKNPEAKALVLAAITNEPGITRPGIGKVTGLGKDMIRIEVERLGRSKLVHSERDGPGKGFMWYASSVDTIIQRVEKAILGASRSVHYREVADIACLTQEQVAKPIHTLVERKVIVKMGSIVFNNLPISLYCHRDNMARVSPIEERGVALGLPPGEYESLIAKGCSAGDIKDYAFLYAKSFDELPQFMRG